MDVDYFTGGDLRSVTIERERCFFAGKRRSVVMSTHASSSTRPLSVRKFDAGRSSQTTAISGARDERRVQVNRRALLGGLGLGALLQVQPASARAIVTTCDPSAEGQDCRMSVLREDAKNSKLSDFEGPKQELTAQYGVPVSVLDDEYVRATRELGVVITRYTELDPYDPERQAAIKTIKSDGPAWVSKYARGGSARKQSARKFYIVIDAVLGFIAAYGLAPFPVYKTKKILADIDLTTSLLDKNL
ncbi:hypothetical protein BSKO_08525 [Bryopsis sp. KO-2023]|nr:hypothetical protein BSKO_08525 [Bryopsis sp. KO-2023]